MARSLRTQVTAILIGLSAIWASWANGEAAPPALRFDLRYHAESTLNNSVDETVIYRARVFPWLNAELGARLAESFHDLELFGYKGELVFPAFSFLSLRTRLSHFNLLPDNIEFTQLLFYGELTGRLGDSVELFAAFGWHERFTQLTKTFVIPSPRGSYREHDFAAAIGGRVQFIDSWWASAKMATFEEFEVHNLNNPYIQLGLEYNPLPAVSLQAYARYKVLLGFGRLDTFTGGLSVNIAFPYGEED